MSQHIAVFASAVLLSPLIVLAPAPNPSSQSGTLRVSIGDLDDAGTRYLGRVITVTAEVDEVYGPRLFTIDDPAWGDLGGEVLVYARGMAAVPLSDGDRISVTGTLQTVALSGIESEWGWRKVEPEPDVDFLTKPLILATHIVSSEDGRQLAPERRAAEMPGNAPDTITDVALVAAGTEDLIGRPVFLRDVRVLRLATNHGFFVDAPQGAIFVLPESSVPAMVAPGSVVTIHGVIARAPRRMPGEFNPPLGWNPRIYLVATTITQ